MCAHEQVQSALHSKHPSWGRVPSPPALGQGGQRCWESRWGCKLDLKGQHGRDRGEVYSQGLWEEGRERGQKGLRAQTRHVQKTVPRLVLESILPLSLLAWWPPTRSPGSLGSWL